MRLEGNLVAGFFRSRFFGALYQRQIAALPGLDAAVQQPARPPVAEPGEEPDIVSLATLALVSIPVYHYRGPFVNSESSQGSGEFPGRKGAVLYTFLVGSGIVVPRK